MDKFNENNLTDEDIILLYLYFDCFFNNSKDYESFMTDNQVVVWYKQLDELNKSRVFEIVHSRVISIKATDRLMYSSALINFTDKRLEYIQNNKTLHLEKLAIEHLKLSEDIYHKDLMSIIQNLPINQLKELIIFLGKYIVESN
ncbi:MAG: hypothetical protein MUE85_03635 [Microscillaceae bacterium]|nr:hypothetical protein [Microscillaceae bacterium]